MARREVLVLCRRVDRTHDTHYYYASWYASRPAAPIEVTNATERGAIVPICGMKRKQMLCTQRDT